MHYIVQGACSQFFGAQIESALNANFTNISYITYITFLHYIHLTDITPSAC